jgi:formylglycine-generating enzyme required for sulfatase activity/DNA-binding winged helix-turn-helix (wHTH) protein
LRYLFEDCVLDTDRRELRRAAALVPVEPQVFDLLVYLICNRERVVSRDDLVASIWRGRIVSESTLNTRISAARSAVGDNGEEQRLIKTLPRKGVRFVAAVREDQQPAEAVPRQPNLAAQAPRPVAHNTATIIPASQESPDGYATRPPEGSHEVAVDGGTWRRILPAFQSHKPRTWGAAAVALLCIGWGAALLIWRAPAPAEKQAHVGLAPEAPPPLKLRPVFRDCDICPEMVALPAGEFMMGSAKDDADRAQIEGPPRRVIIARSFAIGRFEITVDQFAAFVEQTATTVSKSSNPCRVVTRFDVDPLQWTGLPEASFRRPGFEVTGAHPAGCISWYDAQAYVAWLKRRTGKPYRLPTEAEWEYAARAGTTTRFGFGNDERLLCDYARFADLTSRYSWREACRGGIATEGPIPVGKLKPNAWGIFDMHGNVAEWVEDCWTPNWTEIPTDGSAYSRPGNCEMGVTRGGAWISNSRRLRAAYRSRAPTQLRAQVIGFRVALTLGTQ